MEKVFGRNVRQLKAQQRSTSPGTTRSTRAMVAWLCTLVISSALLSACEPAQITSPRRTLRLLMHPVQVSRVGSVLQRNLQKAMPEIDVEILEQSKELEIVTAIQEETADIALAHADASYLAYAGELHGPRFDRLRGIATLNTSPVYFLVGKDSAIRDLHDLRGQTVNVGLPGTTTALTLEIVLRTLGNDVKKSYESIQDALPKLADGRVQAVFAVGGYPLEIVRTTLIEGRARLLTFSEVGTRGLRREHPFIRPVVIPRGIYEDEPLPTMGIERLLLCREGLDEEIVYRVTKAFFESLPELSASDWQLRQMDVENAPSTLVPLHDGAARYYREQEQL
jgi:hypothetical protein